MPNLSKTIKFVGNNQKWMAQQHSGTGVPHHCFGLRLSFGLVAMDRTVGASGLILAVRTFLQPNLNIVKKVSTFLAESTAKTIMVRRTVNLRHLRYGEKFTSQVSVVRDHSNAFSSRNAKA
jgi:hypothetical protein